MWPATLSSPAVRADVLITILAAIGAFAYLDHLAERAHRSLIESRTRLLVATVGVLCGIRALAWMYPGELAIQVVAFMPATVLPLAMTLFVEGLLRRHVPVAIKLSGVGIGLVAFLVNVLRPVLGPTITNTALGASFAACLLVHMAALGIVLRRRDTRSLSRAENGLVDAVFWTTLAALPLAATDFRPALGWPPNRMGGLAALVFLYTMLRPARARARRRHWLVDLARLAAIAAVGVLAFAFLVGIPGRDSLVHWGSASLAIVLLAAVMQRMRELRSGSRMRSLLDWAAEPVPMSLDQFARSLRRLPLTADALLLDEAQLQGYDPDRLAEALRTGAPVRSHGALASASPAPDRAREELLDLLDRHQMTHVAVIREHPLLLLLVASPELPGAGEAEQEIAVVVRRAQHALALEGAARAHTLPEARHVH